jgi:hypothetical protein
MKAEAHRDLRLAATKLAHRARHRDPPARHRSRCRHVGAHRSAHAGARQLAPAARASAPPCARVRVPALARAPYLDARECHRHQVVLVDDGFWHELRRVLLQVELWLHRLHSAHGRHGVDLSDFDAPAVVSTALRTSRALLSQSIHCECSQWGFPLRRTATQERGTTTPR